MIRPGERTVRWLGLLAVAALLAPLVPGLGWVLLAATGALGLAAALEAVLLGRARLEAERPARMALSLGEVERVELVVRASTRRALWLELRQVWPELLEPAASTRRVRLGPGELARLGFDVRAIARGAAVLEKPRAAASFWGLAERVVTLESAGEVDVLPNLRAVARLHGELNRFALRGTGNRADVRLGKGREFDRLRDYVTGDDFRDVAWKASAHHRKLIVREFRVDRAQDVVVCIDRGHRMAARIAGLTRLDHAINAAMLIAYVCNRIEDRVGLVTFAAEADLGVPQGRGKTHLRRLTRHTTELLPELLHTDYAVLAARLRRRLRHRSLVLLLTAAPELEEGEVLVRSVGLLTPQHLPLVLFFTDPDLEATTRMLPADKDELCRTLVARDLWARRQRTIAALRRRGALVVETPPGEAGLEGVNAYLDVKRRQLL